MTVMEAADTQVLRQPTQVDVERPPLLGAGVEVPSLHV